MLADASMQHYWAWDVIDEFIYQFNTFCSYRNHVAKKSGDKDENIKPEMQEEIQMLRDNPQTWGCYSVLNVRLKVSISELSESC